MKQTVRETGKQPPGIVVKPVTLARFDDLRTMVGPKRDDANVCWCLSHRLPAKQNRELLGPARGEYVKSLTRKKIKPGVLAYDGDEVVGWAAVAPRAELPFARSTKIPHVDDLPVWSVWCIRVRPGHRGRGISHALLRGAVDYARSHGAPAVEGYPVDNQGEKVDITMAYVGTRGLFEAAGFTLAARTDASSDGFPRVLMRLDLTDLRPASALSAGGLSRPPCRTG
jgi:GNAT superfamily N-acetyltransferase